MPIEIERKFLIENDTWRSQVSQKKYLKQGYLKVSGNASVRIRIDGSEARLNIKAAVTGAARAEYDYAVPYAEGLDILDKLCGNLLEKTRHFIENPQNLVWEIDEFHGENQGLIVAEIELPSEDFIFEKPEWLGEEVTEQARYYNHALASHPFSKW